MYQGNVTFDLLQRSVIAVPPLCRGVDGQLDAAQNRRLVRYLEAGDVTTLMYGGNANFYNLAASDTPAVLAMLAEVAADDSWVIPSCGPDFGKMMDQLPALRDSAFPTVMVLPLGFPAAPKGVEAGIRRFVDALGKPVIAYIKQDNYLRPDQVAAMVEDGIICAIKYATVRPDPKDDAYLAALCHSIDHRYVISGIGERPVIDHWTAFGLRAFTSGSVCVAPRASTAIKRALQAGAVDRAIEVRKAFLPLENARDDISPIRVLHGAIALAGIAESGPHLPMLAGLEADEERRVAKAAIALRGYDTGFERSAG